MEETIGCGEDAACLKARALLKEVYAVSNTGLFSLDFSLCERLRWSAISIVLSIVDGTNGNNGDERSRFLAIAERSAAEFRTTLAVAMDRDYLTKESFDLLYGWVNEIAGIIGGCLREICPLPSASSPPDQEAEAATGRKVETRVVRPELFGWCRGYSEDTGLWGWKLRGFSNQS